VAFVMVHTNATTTRNKLDGLREKARKFICINDDVDHTDPASAKTLNLVRAFYQWAYPHPSQFELPAGKANPVLYYDELLALQEHGWRIKMYLWVVLALVAVFLALCLPFKLARDRNWTRDRRKRESNSTKLLRL